MFGECLGHDSQFDFDMALPKAEGAEGNRQIYHFVECIESYLHAPGIGE